MTEDYDGYKINNKKNKNKKISEENRAGEDWKSQNIGINVKEVLLKIGRTTSRMRCK